MDTLAIFFGLMTAVGFIGAYLVRRHDSKARDVRAAQAERHSKHL